VVAADVTPRIRFRCRGCCGRAQALQCLELLSKRPVLSGAIYHVSGPTQRFSASPRAHTSHSVAASSIARRVHAAYRCRVVNSFSISMKRMRRRCRCGGGACRTQRSSSHRGTKRCIRCTGGRKCLSTQTALFILPLFITSSFTDSAIAQTFDGRPLRLRTKLKIKINKIGMDLTRPSVTNATTLEVLRKNHGARVLGWGQGLKAERPSGDQGPDGTGAHGRSPQVVGD
jgi:hypothetical protein